MKFSELGIKPTVNNIFIGDKIKMAKIIGQEIKLYGYKIEDSNKKAGTKCLVLAFEFKSERRINFTSGKVLMSQLEQLDKSLLPINCKIIDNQGTYQFE